PAPAATGGRAQYVCARRNARPGLHLRLGGPAVSEREFSPSALAGEPPWLALFGLTLADAHDGLLQCGVDVIEIPRIAAAIERWGQPILDRVWTPAEQRFCRGRVPELAARFAAKEAVSKTLGTGI